MLKVVIAALLALAFASSAQAAEDFGPAVGATAPDIGTPLDQKNKPRSLQSLMGEKGVVLFFYRSAAWCPYCQTQMIDLNGSAGEIEKRGYRLAGVSYDAPDVLAAFAEKRGLTYPLLSDPKSEIIDRYGLRDPQYAQGSKAYGVPRPIILVVGRDGTIKAKLFEDTFRKRPPVGLVIETLDKVAAIRS
jgi:peroxiredoxin